MMICELFLRGLRYSWRLWELPGEGMAVAKDLGKNDRGWLASWR